MSALDDDLRELARTPILLVAADYDGTLAPIVDDPAEARPQREALVALHALAALPQTHVAVVSGRSLRTLADLSGTATDVHLIGSHGSEFDFDFTSRLPPEALELRSRIDAALAAIASRAPGLRLERKPASVAFHYRLASEEDAGAAVAEILAGPATWPGVSVQSGKKVLELSVVPTDKGAALQRLRHRFGATAALFAGDDATDEAAFGALGGPDVGVKVGDGDSAARHRVADPLAVARLLATLAEEREAWLAGDSAVPIERHSLLSDMRTAALVTPGGRVSWLCLPRIDSPALMADLLGGAQAGHFDVAPSQAAGDPVQEYDGGSMIVRTSWPGLTVTDYLDCSASRAGHRAGRSDLVRVVEGTVPASVTFAPRLDFGRIATRLRPVPDGLAVEGTLDPIVLRAPGLAWEIRDDGIHQSASAVHDPAGAALVLELRYGTAVTGPAPLPEATRRANVKQFWEDWMSRLTLPRTARSLVARSALVLKSLCHGPTGAIVAAPTTSLPEEIGGSRNWDYRFCWIRDGAISARALARLGSHDEGMRFLDWLLGVLETTASPERLHPLYTVGGRSTPAEAVLAELAGYRASRPVRVGNAAAGQIQRDVFGPVADLVAVLHEAGAPLSADHVRVVEAMAEAVAAGWNEPDHGIWEARRPRRHHVHSKVMSWLALDRASFVAQAATGRSRPEWRELRDRIATEVAERGWNPALGAFSGCYEEAELDAAALQVGLSGMLPTSDVRVLRTIEAVERGLRMGPGVRRYLHDDGLAGSEGAFLLCSTWLVEAYVMSGRLRDAHELLEGICELAGPTGLLPEEWCPKTGRGLGNHPQAYSHAGLIEAAVRLDSLA